LWLWHSYSNWNGLQLRWSPNYTIIATIQWSCDIFWGGSHCYYES
jgi:hypothetical protein